MADVDTSSSALSLDSEEHIVLDNMMDMDNIPIPDFELLCLKSFGAGLAFGSCLTLQSLTHPGHPYFNITCLMYHISSTKHLTSRTGTRSRVKS